MERVNSILFSSSIYCLYCNKTNNQSFDSNYKDLCGKKKKKEEKKKETEWKNTVNITA